MKTITITLDDKNFITNYVPISYAAEMIERELREHGIVRKAMQQTLQNPFKPIYKGVLPNFFEHHHIKTYGGKKGSGYILLDVRRVREYILDARSREMSIDKYIEFQNKNNL